MADRSLLDALRADIARIESDGKAHRAQGHAVSMQHAPEGSDELGSSTASSHSEVSELQDEGAKAYAKILRLCTATERSENQLRTRLLKDGFSEEACDTALAKAVSYGIVDDLRYAEWLVRSRLRQGWGIEGIRRELKSMGFSLDMLPDWPEAFDYDDDEDAQLERALEYLSAHAPRSKNKRDGAYRKLMQKGYAVGICSRAARIWSDANGLG